MKTKHTSGTWRVIETKSEEYPKHIDYSVHADEQELHTEIDNETSPLWKFRPHIADIRFGRSNEEREANAKLLSALQTIMNCFVHKDGDAKGNKVRTDIFKHCPEFRQACVEARGAIDKATN